MKRPSLAAYERPLTHWTRLRTNNVLDRIIREIRRRTRVVGAFPDLDSALVLVAARLRHVTGTHWGGRVYLDMSRLTPARTPDPAPWGNPRVVQPRTK